MRTLLLLLLAARVEAATEYRITIEQTGNPLAPPRREVTVLVDGANWSERAGGVTTRLSNDGGKTVIALDHKLGTWWVAKSVTRSEERRVGKEWRARWRTEE